MVRANFAVRAAEVAIYDNWSADFCKKQISEAVNRLVSSIGPIRLGDLTPAECDELGFGKWSDDSELRLIPIWLYPFLSPGETLHCIDGSTDVVGAKYATIGEDGYIDGDHRGGMLAFGIMPVEHAA